MSAHSQLSILRFVSTTQEVAILLGMEMMLYHGPHHRQVTWMSQMLMSHQVVSLIVSNPLLVNSTANRVVETADNPGPSTNP